MPFAPKPETGAPFESYRAINLPVLLVTVERQSPATTIPPSG
jgi:hypothetical protein